MKPSIARWVLFASAFWLSACAKPSTLKSPSGARRVTTPNGMASLCSDHETTGLPAEIRFGGSFGRSALYLKFPPESRAHASTLRAFVALSPRAGAPRNDSSVTIEAWRISSEWQPSELHSWSDKPNLAPPYASTAIGSAPAGDFRIEVTELARFAAQHPERDFGIALLASGGSGHGVSFATGIAGGAAPRLEIYER